jgi:hypothetical protein
LNKKDKRFIKYLCGVILYTHGPFKNIDENVDLGQHLIKTEDKRKKKGQSLNTELEV